MKKNIIKKLALSLASVLLLTACGSAEDEVITGNDWRVTGSYAWMTFEHGETINALVGMDADKLTVFYDKDTKEVYRSVAFPYETTNLQNTFNSLVCEDLNEDGYTDIRIFIYDQQGSEYEVEFLWDADASDFTCIAPSLEAEGDFTFTNFVGAWKLDEDEKTVIIIDSEQNWENLYDGEITVMGNAEIDYGTVVLYTTEGTYFCTLTYEDKSVFDEFGNGYSYDGPADEYVPDGIIVFPVMGE